MELNFVFCERDLYDGTAPEQKTENAKNGLNPMFKPFFRMLHQYNVGRMVSAPTISISVKLFLLRGSDHFIDSLSIADAMLFCNMMFYQYLFAPSMWIPCAEL